MFILIVFIILFIFFKWQNNSITINEIVFKHDKILNEFDGYKILQISDFHNKRFGHKQHKILKKIEKINPDIIVVTGDLIDSNKTNIDSALDLINGTCEIAQVFYVSGNHEAWCDSYQTLKTKLDEVGVTILDNNKIEISKGSSFIELIGLSDASFFKSDTLEYNKFEEIENTLSNLVKLDKKFKILLSHRPELFNIYSNSEVDLVFSGHAHGGQFRIPLIGGLIAPDQGIFPRFSEGIHKNNKTSMIISRGLGNSIIPIRIFNRPELVVVTFN